MAFDILNQVPEERLKVVISRHWSKPSIEITINRERIEVVIGLAEFMRAVAEEMPPAWKQWTKAKQDAAINAAYLKAVEKVKEATAAVM